MTGEETGKCLPTTQPQTEGKAGEGPGINPAMGDRGRERSPRARGADLGTHLGAYLGPPCSQSSAAPPAGSSCDGCPLRSVSPGLSATAAGGG